MPDGPSPAGPYLPASADPPGRDEGAPFAQPVAAHLPVLAGDLAGRSAVGIVPARGPFHGDPVAARCDQRLVELHVADRGIVEALVEGAHLFGAARDLPAVPFDDRIVGIQRHRRLDVAPAVHRLGLAHDPFGFACIHAYFSLITDPDWIWQLYSKIEEPIIMYEELLHWSGTRPSWQQDALRRLALQGELTEDDITALESQIEAKAGFHVENAHESVPLAAEHLVHGTSNDPKTVLASLGPVRNIDRLSPDQPPLRFAVNGITLVYGPNGSGKSGYCRIAKQLCRSLSPSQLRGDVYHNNAQSRPEVSVTFGIGSEEESKEERIWYGDEEPPRDLSRISVFDTAAARVYVDKERKIEFLPYELDLMNKLGIACRSIEKKFKDRLEKANADIKIPLPKGYHEGTAVQDALAKLILQTPLTKIPSEQELRLLGTWTQEKQAKFDFSIEQIRGDKNELVRLRTEAKQALKSVSEEISNIEEKLSDQAIARIRKTQQDAEKLERAAEVAGEGLFDDQPISGLGSETWRQMLKYAQEFATTAFPSAPPPQLATGGKCVLCQQELEESAVERMTAFENYILGRTVEQSTVAKGIFVDQKNSLLAFKVKKRNEVEILLAGYSALGDTHKIIAAEIADFVEKSRKRHEFIISVFKYAGYDSLDDLTPLPASPVQRIEDEIGLIESQLIELNDVQYNRESLIKLQAQRAELADQKRLSEGIEMIIERRNRLENYRRLDKCCKQCTSTAITRRITDRRRLILTPKLKENLEKEMEKLHLSHIPLDLSDRGRGAESIVEVALNTQQRIANNSDVLSEGEQRALALACFLAELGEIGSDHGIIVDDPVSSLDHGRMQAVAERLAEEAANGRQVIVFTHNILFHYMLSTETRRAKVSQHSEWMTSMGNDRFGLIDDYQKPWQMKGVFERLKEIRQDFKELVGDNYEISDQRCRPSVIELYTKMRETWERIVEEILFNNAVQRFRPEVMTLRLKEACFNSEVDFPIIFEGMTRCSQYSGHDPAMGIPSDLPEPSRIDRDIRDLADFAETARVRRKERQKAPRYEDGVVPVFL